MKRLIFLILMGIETILLALNAGAAENPGHEHTFSEWDFIVEPISCTESYTEFRLCPVCYTMETRVRPPSHDLMEWTETQAPSCNTAGEEMSACRRRGCSFMQTRAVPALGHDFADAFTTDKAPTLTSDGEQSRHCSRCDARTDLTEIDILGHRYREWLTVSEVSCTADGKRVRICLEEDCLYEDQEITPAWGHDYGAWMELKKPMCTESGSEYRFCWNEGCTCSETRAVPALGHDFSDGFTIDQSPACTEEGEQSRHCSRCDERTDIAVMDPSGHRFGDWVTVTGASCTADGRRVRTCLEENCTYEEAETISAPGHDYSEWDILKKPSCTEAGSEFRICQRNGCTLLETRVSAALDHDLTDWTVTKMPTCTAAGEEMLACRRFGCSFKQIRVLSSFGHLWDDGVITAVPTAKKDGECVYACLTCGNIRTEILPFIVLPGDVNGDGTVTPADAELLAAYFAGHSCETLVLEAADVDGIPGVTRADAMFLARCFAEWPGYVLP